MRSKNDDSPITLRQRKCGPRFWLPNGHEIFAVWHRKCQGVAFMYGKDPSHGGLKSADAFNLDGTRPKPRSPMVCGTCGEQIKTYDLLDSVPANPKLDPRYFRTRLDQWQETGREVIYPDELEYADLFQGGQVRPSTNIKTAIVDRVKRYNGRVISSPGVKPRAPIDPIKLILGQR